VQAAGFQFVEASVQALLEGMKPDGEWKGLEAATACPLPIPSVNVMVPGSLKITGPEADLGKLREYMDRVLERARKTRTTIIVFGSGGARQVPEGFDREEAKQQIVAFANMIAPIAQTNGVTIVLEPLHSGECNIINTVAEAMEYVRAVNHPNFMCLVDSYHLWMEGEPVEHVRESIAAIRHVHVADREGRVALGESGKSDCRELFGILKASGYTGLISLEATFSDIAGSGARVLEFLQGQWKEA
jgi:sugar phosphate isomerase/epimerase